MRNDCADTVSRAGFGKRGFEFPIPFEFETARIKIVLKNIERSLFVVLISIIFSGCFGNETSAWREEVRLDDGRIITISRQEYFEMRGGFFEPMPHQVRVEIQFDGDPEISWASEHLHPLIVGYHEGSPYVISTFNDCSYWNYRSEPEPPYLTYLYRKGRWEELTPNWLPNHVDRNLATGSYGMSLVNVKYKDEVLKSQLPGRLETYRAYDISAKSHCGKNYKLGDEK